MTRHPYDPTLPDEGGGGNKELPKSLFRAKLNLGGVEVDVHVLDALDSDGNNLRVISLRSAVAAIAQVDHGKLGDFLALTGIKSSLPADFELGEIEFRIRRAPNGKGITANAFTVLCQTFVRALVDNQLRTKRQLEQAARCSLLMSACAATGLIALIDEATGFQKVRHKRALRDYFEAFLLDDPAEWERLFPETIWEEIGRLEGRSYVPSVRPRHWGKLVLRFFYFRLPAAVRAELKKREPNPERGKNMHQHFTPEVRRIIATTIQQVIPLMRSCATMRDFKNRFGAAFHRRPLQLDLAVE